MKKLFLFSLAACLMAATAQAQTFTGLIVEDQIALIEFTTTDIFAADGDWLEINTLGTTQLDGGTPDTALFLFSGSGGSATYTGVEGEDDGVSFLTALSFGAGGGATGPNGSAGFNDDTTDGSDGDLAAGTYTLVVSGFIQSDPDFIGQTIDEWQLTDVNSESDSHNYVVNIASFNAVPEPASAAVLLCAAFGVAARRRR